MVLGAVIAAGVRPDPIRAALDSLGLPIKLEVEPVKRCGFAATKATVEAADQEEDGFLPDVEAILARGNMTGLQRALATALLRKRAHAEAAAHGMPLERVHFHEVGALDSIADIVGAAVGLDLLGVETFTSSPVPTGTGTVKCAHGIMPVPTPGTAELLKGVPLASSAVKGELTTPTGAAILTTVVAEFTASPAMTIEAIGHGAGTKDFIEQPNILRLFVGVAPDARGRPSPGLRPAAGRLRRGPPVTHAGTASRTGSGSTRITLKQLSLIVHSMNSVGPRDTSPMTTSRFMTMHWSGWWISYLAPSARTMRNGSNGV